MHMSKIEVFFLNRFVTNFSANERRLFMLTGFTYLQPRLMPAVSASVYNLLLEKYWRRRKKDPVVHNFKENKIKVTCVVRRGEITDLWRKKHWQGKLRWVELDWYIGVLRNINSIIGEQDIDIHIYSDVRNRSELSKFEELPNSTVHFIGEGENEYSRQAFHAMVISDIMVCAISGFAAQGGMLSRGVKILPPSEPFRCRFPKSMEWVPSDRKGNFDRNCLLSNSRIKTKMSR